MAADGAHDAREKFLQLWLQEQDGLVRWAQLLGAGSHAEDAVQQGFLSIWSRKKLPAQVGKPYIYTVCKRRVVDMFRGNKRSRRIEAGYSAVAQHEDDGLDPFDDSHTSAALQALAALDGRIREAFVLHAVHGLSYAAVAQELSVSEATAEQYVCRGRAQIRKSIDSSD